MFLSLRLMKNFVCFATFHACTTTHLAGSFRFTCAVSECYRTCCLQLVRRKWNICPFQHLLTTLSFFVVASQQAVHHDVYNWLHAPKIQAAGKINMDEEAIVPCGLVPVFWGNGVQHLKNSLHRRDHPWTSYRSYMQKLVELCDVIWCHALLEFLYSWSREAFPHSGGTFQAPAEQWQNKASLPPFWWRWHCGLWTWLFLKKTWTILIPANLPNPPSRHPLQWIIK